MQNKVLQKKLKKNLHKLKDKEGRHKQGLSRYSLPRALGRASLMRKAKGAIALLGILLALENVHATVTVGELSRLQSEIILLQAKLKQADLQAELRAKSHRNPSNEALGLPVVQAVYGVGNERYATFLYGSGALLDAKPGDLILDGFTVASIRVDQVLLRKGKQHVAIGFAVAPFNTAQTVSTPISKSQSLGFPTSLPALLKYP